MVSRGGPNPPPQIAFGGGAQPSSSSSSAAGAGNMMNKAGFAGGYDMGELDQALFLYLEGQERSAGREQRPSM
ncbi:unnamed protein product [Spirodela intermedia]|uniref:Uncharacterized protein n=2 Tax=Spirodela intermedia TaxID=51605 RepID=A0A7I8JL22_SPIIN|nr:unnamed protein product [Spirodela intermedia]CAA6670182.1 unnamed protein product [Spirodela intermedia]CAA7407232.1 unnamed protein product [Spirodela intermedia]